MNASEIGSTLCRIVGVFLFVRAAQAISWISLKTFIITGDLSDFAVGLLITVVPPLVGGSLLWKYSDRIARIGDKFEAPKISTSLTRDDLLEAGIFLVGLYAVLFGLVTAIDIELIDWMTRSAGESQSSFYDESLIRNWTKRAGYLLQIILGGGLIYRRSSIVALGRKLGE